MLTDDSEKHKQKDQGLFGEMANTMTRAGNMKDDP